MTNFDSSKFICILISLIAQKCRSANIDLTIPEGFIIGASTSNFQIEGAWNISDKAESSLDLYVHTHPEDNAGDSADVACDSYHKYKEDVEQIQNIGLDFYRFSLSWSRILPNGTTDYVSNDGLRYYHNLLDELNGRGIMPFITLYHWDYPHASVPHGGWLNEKMAYLFSDFARLIFREFGTKAKYFLTFNEPSVLCLKVYNSSLKNGTDAYMCLHNKLKAHALAYHIYNEEFRSENNGQIGIGLKCRYQYNKNESDHTSANIAFEFDCGWQANPIYSATGDYPEIMKQKVAGRSKLQGFNCSRLPTFSKQWIEYIKGSADFFGLNHYITKLVSPLPKSSELDWPTDEGLEYSFDPNWPSTVYSEIKVVPEGFGNLIRDIKEKYNNPPMYITENGVSAKKGVEDNSRINYLYSYMKEVLIAITRDKCDVRGYTIWSLLDSFEWIYGYTEGFGLVSVDFNDTNRKRTPKKSALWLSSVIASRKLTSPYLYTNFSCSAKY